MAPEILKRVRVPSSSRLVINNGFMLLYRVEIAQKKSLSFYLRKSKRLAILNFWYIINRNSAVSQPRATPTSKCRFFPFFDAYYSKILNLKARKTWKMKKVNTKNYTLHTKQMCLGYDSKLKKKASRMYKQYPPYWIMMRIHTNLRNSVTHGTSLECMVPWFDRCNLFPLSRRPAGTSRRCRRRCAA
jgi:hypothetical protein